MARKNTLFDVDITRENPLITIVNQGKIPVVEMQDVQFRRFKSVSLFEKHDKWVETCEKNGIHYVTYCNIGGFHGVDFSDLTIVENINIGYVEPDTLVFDMTSGAVITAKRKLQSVKNAWDSLLKKENENDITYGKWSWFTEHFANFQCVLVDTKSIKKVWTIPTTNFKSYLPYMKDGHLGIGCVQNYLIEIIWNILTRQISMKNGIKKLIEIPPIVNIIFIMNLIMILWNMIVDIKEEFLKNC